MRSHCVGGAASRRVTNKAACEHANAPTTCIVLDPIPRQKIQHELVELSLALHLHPVAALREDMHLRILHRTGHEQADIQRAGAIVHSPQHQRRRRNPWELGCQVLADRRGAVLTRMSSGSMLAS